MRYLGGKTRIAKRLAEAVRANTTATKLWEPFCGGLNATRALADVGFEVHASDVNAAVITLYQAWLAGWRPPAPEALSREGHAAAKKLPDSDPLKAFYGIGLSFGANWFCTYTGTSRYVQPNAAKGRVFDDYGAVCKSLDRDTAKPTSLRTLSFYAWPAEPSPGWAIYADPPYANTGSYRGVVPFDHTAFWRRCREWQAAGVDVFVSEYSAPPDVPIVAEWSSTKTAARVKTSPSTERLYLLAAEKEQRA